MDNYTVNIQFKNKDLETVATRSYTLSNYCEELRFNVMKTIMDVENAFYELQGEKGKRQWDDDTLAMFNRIRHNLLNTANNIQRLPSNLYHNGRNINAIGSGEYVANIVNQITKKE